MTTQRAGESHATVSAAAPARRLESAGSSQPGRASRVELAGSSQPKTAASNAAMRSRRPPAESSTDRPRKKRSRPVFERLALEPPTASLFLTDGFGEAPAEVPAYPVLWVLTADGERPAPPGRVPHRLLDMTIGAVVAVSIVFDSPRRLWMTAAKTVFFPTICGRMPDGGRR